MRSRIDFAWHLRRSILVPMPQSSGLSAAVLPLPLLSSSSWCWKSHVGLSKRRLFNLGRARVLHACVGLAVPWPLPCLGGTKQETYGCPIRNYCMVEVSVGCV